MVTGRMRPEKRRAGQMVETHPHLEKLSMTTGRENPEGSQQKKQFPDKGIRVTLDWPPKPEDGEARSAKL